MSPATRAGYFSSPAGVRVPLRRVRLGSESTRAAVRIRSFSFSSARPRASPVSAAIRAESQAHLFLDVLTESMNGRDRESSAYNVNAKENVDDGPEKTRAAGSGCCGRGNGRRPTRVGSATG